ncbi:hypothetical protein MU1_48100 [Paenibacillus glycanilyticus]|uniref:Dienelactone hydrolase domain-containing protein n=2 Tax=Paenibacillus glycanilyticus TaxID=126569 RepID=A0ABQ6GHQ4_9BACL|nr:hypothetical protein MU1_48100 [Paenibacillus glycanilyticus]
MIEINNHSDNAIIVAHEIYGLNQHMASVCSALGEQGYDVYAPDLLHTTEPYRYEQEQAAYNDFMAHVGFEKASALILQLAKQLKKQYRNVYLVGFSVGATAAWVCSACPDISGVVGYYGSRIRGYKQLEPACPVLLFYPEVEPSFDVDQLISELRERPQIQVHKLTGQHGFGDPYSERYVPASADAAYQEMLAFLKSIG